MTDNMATSECTILNTSTMFILQGILIFLVTLIGNSNSNSEVCPSLCRCLDKSSIITCRRAGMTHVPEFPSTTIVADLDQNDISILYNYTFDTASRIEIISLEDNGVIHVEGGAFLSVPDLEILRLGKNHISYLPRDIFQNNRKLEVLDLHGNSFTQIPDYVMFPLHRLQLLNMSFNSLTTPMLGQGFKVTTKIGTIDLTGNNLVALESHVFQATLWWDDKVKHHLNLSYCNIQHIFPNTLNQLYHLDSLSLEGNDAIPYEQLKMALNELSISSFEILNLSRMNITDIYEFFHRSQHRNLVKLSLSNNYIRELRSRTFYYLTKLRFLDLSFNELTSLGDLDGLANVEYLYLSHNFLEKIHATTFDGLQLLRVLDLSHNRLLNVDDTPFQNLFDLQILNLGSNHLTSFAITTGFENLEVLSLGSNRLRSMYSVGMLMKLRNLDMSANEIDFLGPNTFSRGQSLTAVNFSHNLISFLDGNTFADSSVDVLDISHNKLTSLHYYGLQGVKSLYAQANAIKNISVDAFYRLNTLSLVNLELNDIHWLPRYLFTPVYTLKSISLSHNPLGGYLQRTGVLAGFSKLETLNLAGVGLKQIPSKLFSNMSFLKSLDISSNKLSSVDSYAFQNASRITFLNMSHNLLTVPSIETLQSLPHLQIVDLSGNPFQCTCELMPFRNWLLVTNTTVLNSIDPNFYYCSGPAEWRGVSVLDFQLDSGTCSHQEKAVIFASIGCTLLIIILTIIFAIYRYKRWSKNKLDRTQYRAINHMDTGNQIQINSNTQTELQQHCVKEWV